MVSEICIAEGIRQESMQAYAFLKMLSGLSDFRGNINKSFEIFFPDMLLPTYNDAQNPNQIYARVHDESIIQDEEALKTLL